MLRIYECFLKFIKSVYELQMILPAITSIPLQNFKDIHDLGNHPFGIANRPTKSEGCESGFFMGGLKLTYSLLMSRYLEADYRRCYLKI